MNTAPTTAAVMPTPEQLAARKQAAADQARIDGLFATQREALITALGYQLHQEAGSAAKPAWADSRQSAETQVDAALAAVKNQMVGPSTLARLNTAATAKGLTAEQTPLEIISLISGNADRSLLGVELGINDADVTAARQAGLLREFLDLKLAGYKPAASPASAPAPAPAAPPQPEDHS